MASKSSFCLVLVALVARQFCDAVNSENDRCMCEKPERRMQNTTSTQSVFVPCLFDTTNFPWAEEIYRFTASLINNHSDGWHDDVLNDGTVLEFTVVNSACDATIATRAYWNLRAQYGGKPHALVGCRCVDDSIAVARIAGLENVTQVSPSTTAEALSAKNDFPNFSRVVSAREAEALVSMFRSFGWNRVTVLNTDTEYGKDELTHFQRLWVGGHNDSSGIWEGEIAYSHSIAIGLNGAIDADSVRQALDGVPTHDPTINSRVILLIAHHQHAYRILQIAASKRFQPDTIWVGTSGWVNRPMPNSSDTWFRPLPGYLGVTPFRNRNADYQDFLERLQVWQREEGRAPWDELPDYTVEHMADSLLSVAKALSVVSHDKRQDGNYVTAALRNLVFDGISGHVSFTQEGDRRDPQFTIFNFKEKNGTYSWVHVGSVNTTVGESVMNGEVICFAVAGCDPSAAPSDSYPLPRDRASTALKIGLPVFAFLLLVITIMYCRTHLKKKRLKESMTEMQRRLAAMKKIDEDLLDIDEQVEAAKKRQADLIKQRAALQDVPDTWSNNTLRTLVAVGPEEDQYWNVLYEMRKTMSNAHISNLWRVQNTSLWTYYSFHKQRLSMHNIAHGERSVWHGTSSLDPSIIYDDKQDGFMMQFAAKGFWGRGIYFAENADYSDHYAYKPPPSVFPSDDRPNGKSDEKEIFLAKLLGGNAILMNRDESSRKADECRRLTVPPTNAATGLKYNSVTGHTGGSQVWIVYENGRAYPDYLVRYYCGTRDPTRSPYESQPTSDANDSELDKIEQGLKQGDSSTDTFATSSDSDSIVWEFQDDSGGWQPYSPAHQLIIEKSHQDSRNTVQITTDEWTYEVDVSSFVQTNLNHPSRRQRYVRRCVLW